MFQNGTSSWGGTRKLPYVFTEQGVAMLSGILSSDIAIAVNVQIMRVFTLDNQDKNMEIVFKYLDELVEHLHIYGSIPSRIRYAAGAT